MDEILKYNIDYLICLTGACYPIKNENQILNFIEKNINKSFFIDFSKVVDELYFIDENKKIMQFPFGKMTFNDFFTYSIDHHWHKWMHSRVFRENVFYLFIYLVYRLMFYYKFKMKGPWSIRDKWFFKEKREKFDFKIYSEWYFSTQNYFAIPHIKKYVDYYKGKNELIKFKKLYAPDEKFWISIAKKLEFEDVDFVFKPTGYHCATYLRPKNKSLFYKKHFFDTNNFSTLKSLNKDVLFVRCLRDKYEKEMKKYIDENLLN